MAPWNGPIEYKFRLDDKGQTPRSQVYEDINIKRNNVDHACMLWLFYEVRQRHNQLNRTLKSDR